MSSRLARIAYEAYAKATGGRNFFGNPMPEWEELPQSIRDAWDCAVGAVEYERTCKNEAADFDDAARAYAITPSHVNLLAYISATNAYQATITSEIETNECSYDEWRY